MAQRKTATKAASPRRSSSKAATKSAAAPSHKIKTDATKRPAGRKSKVGDAAVTIDRRRAQRRDESAPAAEAPAATVTLERRKKVNRRRQIDPTTCERDYTEEEIQFMNALDDYKRKSGRMFPTCSEVLEVLRSLGYAKLTPAELATHSAQAAPSCTTSISPRCDAADDHAPVSELLSGIES